MMTCGEHFGNVVGKMLAHQPAVVRGVAPDLPHESEGTVVVQGQRQWTNRSGSR